MEMDALLSDLFDRYGSIDETTDDDDIGDLDVILNLRYPHEKHQYEEDKDLIRDYMEPNEETTTTTMMIPKYLSNDHPALLQTLQQQPWFNTLSSNETYINDLRQIALLIHRLSVIELQRELFGLINDDKQMDTLNEQEKQYQQELELKKTSLPIDFSTIESCLKKFVEQNGLPLLRLKYQMKQKLSQFDSEEQMLLKQFRQQQQQHPTEYQVTFFFFFFD